MFNTLLVRPLFNLLMLFYGLVPGHSFGLAVILLTILVRLALWPVLASQLRSQKKLQELAPEVARVRKEAKGDKQLESKLLMELYKEREINPFASLLPLLIQLPLFIALYVALRDAFKAGEVAKLIYPSLSYLSAIKAILDNPGSLNAIFLGFINLAKPNVILAIVAGIAQYYQTKQLMPKKTQGDVQAQAMAGTTKIFPFLTFLIALRLPSALALYWAVTSAVAIIQQTVELREDVEDLETKTVAAPVETKITSSRKRGKKK